jgi:peptide-O-fucosyltransferase
MRFSSHLVSIANEFVSRIRNSELNGNVDRNTREKLSLFLGVHLRRGDFARYRVKNVPSIECAADQIVAVLERHKIKRVFVASDGVMERESLLKIVNQRSPSTQVYSFDSTLQETSQLLDGEIAIIDQLICSQSDIFIGKFLLETCSYHLFLAFDWRNK